MNKHTFEKFKYQEKVFCTKCNRIIYSNFDSAISSHDWREGANAFVAKDGYMILYKNPGIESATYGCEFSDEDVLVKDILK